MLNGSGKLFMWHSLVILGNTLRDDLDRQNVCFSVVLNEIFVFLF